MNESNFLLFKVVVNSFLATAVGLMGALEIMNAVISMLGGLLFLGVTFFTLRKMYNEHKRARSSDDSEKL